MKNKLTNSLSRAHGVRPLQTLFRVFAVVCALLLSNVRAEASPHEDGGEAGTVEVSSAKGTNRSSASATTYESQTVNLHWLVISSGGTKALVGSNLLQGTAVQTAIGEIVSPNFRVRQGFWQNFSAPCLRGDADGNGLVSITDAVFIVNYIFSGGKEPDSACAADADGNGMVTVSDAVAILELIFFR